MVPPLDEWLSHPSRSYLLSVRPVGGRLRRGAPGGPDGSRRERNGSCYRLAGPTYAVEADGTEGRAWAIALRDVFGRVIRLHHEREQVSLATFARRRTMIEHATDRLVFGPPLAPKSEARRLQERSQTHRDSLYVFLYRDEVEPTNNGSERDVRASLTALSRDHRPSGAIMSVPRSHYLQAPTASLLALRIPVGSHRPACYTPSEPLRASRGCCARSPLRRRAGFFVERAQRRGPAMQAGRGR